MKTKTLSYSYDIEKQILTIYADGVNAGSLSGPVAEERFNQIIKEGANLSFSNMNATEYKSHLIRQFHAALNAQGLLKRKADILAGYAVESTTELNIDQLKELAAQYSTGKPQTTTKTDDPRVRAMRSEMLTICNKMGIYVTNNDWSRVNAFFSDSRIAGKPLSRLSLEELTALVPKMRSILSKHIAKQREIERLKRGN